MQNPNLGLLEDAVRLLQPLLDELVFVGGCTTGLFVTDPGAGGLRVTRDVDVITEVTSYAQYAALSERLRPLGLREDTSQGAPLCRWRSGALVVDIMPTDERILGFSNRWYVPAIASAQTLQIADVTMRVVTPALFLATKLEAFHGRGRLDYGGSHDLEDVIAVVDGRAKLADEIASADTGVRHYVASEMQTLLATRAFSDALAGFLLPDEGSQARLPLLRERLQRIASLTARS